MFVPRCVIIVTYFVVLFDDKKTMLQCSKYLVGVKLGLTSLELVSWSLTSLFITNMAMSETN